MTAARMHAYLVSPRVWAWFRRCGFLQLLWATRPCGGRWHASSIPMSHRRSSHRASGSRPAPSCQTDPQSGREKVQLKFCHKKPFDSLERNNVLNRFTWVLFLTTELYLSTLVSKYMLLLQGNIYIYMYIHIYIYTPLHLRYLTAVVCWLLCRFIFYINNMWLVHKTMQCFKETNSWKWNWMCTT